MVAISYNCSSDGSDIVVRKSDLAISYLVLCVHEGKDWEPQFRLAPV